MSFSLANLATCAPQTDPDSKRELNTRMASSSSLVHLRGPSGAKATINTLGATVTSFVGECVDRTPKSIRSKRKGNASDAVVPQARMV